MNPRALVLTNLFAAAWAQETVDFDVDPNSVPLSTRGKVSPFYDLYDIFPTITYSKYLNSIMVHVRNKRGKYFIEAGGSS